MNQIGCDNSTIRLLEAGTGRSGQLRPADRGIFPAEFDYRGAVSHLFAPPIPISGDFIALCPSAERTPLKSN